MSTAFPPRITLLTDFGTRDGYAAAMKGVIAALCPQAIVDDAGHDLAAGDVLAAALALDRYWRRFPEGTIHLVVVDPGVGGERRGVAVRADNRFLIGPDNGAFTRALEGASQIDARELSNAVLFASAAPTFHGRDVFAPAAAHLANGLELAELGPAAHNLAQLAQLKVVVDEHGLSGQIIHVDRFGNLITNIGTEAATATAVQLNGQDVGPVRRTYSDAKTGEPLALFGSEGLLEIAVRDGSAAEHFGVGRGTRVDIVR